MLLLAVAGVPLKRIVIPTLLGNFTVALLASLAATYGVGFIHYIQ
jgi:hypothetical protein